MSKFLEVIGANTHNLKDVHVKIPKNKLTVITGVSGSGKSSLAFTTIYAEGQRRYLESLSTYARMFIGGTNEETNVSEIKGLSPTISIDQKTVSHNPRSTVGTITEIYDFYRVLYLHIGQQISPETGKPLKKNTFQDIVDFASGLEEKTKFYILAPVVGDFSTFDDVKQEVIRRGFVRFMIDDVVYSLSDENNNKIPSTAKIYIVIDRLMSNAQYTRGSNERKRLHDSVQTAYEVGSDILHLHLVDSDQDEIFSRVAICPVSGYKPAELTLSHFSFNSHHGACPVCQGLGMKTQFTEEHIVNPKLTLSEWALLPWEGSNYYMTVLEYIAMQYKIDVNIPYKDLPKEHKELVLYGVHDKKFSLSYTAQDGTKKTYKTKFEGIIPYLERKALEVNPSPSVLKKIKQFSTESLCPVCNGYRLKSDSLNVFIEGKNIGELSHMSVEESLEFFQNIKLTKTEQEISKGVLKNIIDRLSFLQGVGLSYMTIARRSNTISGGEAQRIRLATQIGTKLEGIVYVLDEPSIGLHPRDNNMLIENLKHLVEIGNTLIVVEHDEDIMKQSDHIIDIGPGAGVHGGTVAFEGTYKKILEHKGETGQYLSNKKVISTEQNLEKPTNFLTIKGAEENNLQKIDVSIPLERMTVVTGVSGSGKSSLINKTLAPFLHNHFNRSKKKVGKCAGISGHDKLDKMILIDQSPIGKTPRSNPATYTGVFTAIRDVFAQSIEAKKRWYGPGHFSFNTKQGQCEVCGGDGVKKIEMHFLPDVYVQCESCHGKRFNSEILEVTYRGKTIADILDMPVEEALDFFRSNTRISTTLQVLMDVGLGYIRLGQSSTTLSGGEAQRIKLATELSKKSTSKTMYILDEPTTGLHFSDIQKLLVILRALVKKGNTVIVIEHNLDFINNADYIVDIGPEGGKYGGTLMFEGGFDEFLGCKKSYTADALKEFRKHKKQ